MRNKQLYVKVPLLLQVLLLRPLLQLLQIYSGWYKVTEIKQERLLLFLVKSRVGREKGTGPFQAYCCGVKDIS